MTKQEQFFYDQASYSWNRMTETEEQGRIRCAKGFAQAEQYASDHDWGYEWIPDGDADPMDWDGEGPIGQEAYGCVLKDSDGKTLCSLWGIWDPSNDYTRVIEAELAYEAMIEHEKLDAYAAGYAALGV